MQKSLDKLLMASRTKGAYCNFNSILLPPVPPSTPHNTAEKVCMGCFIKNSRTVASNWEGVGGRSPNREDDVSASTCTICGVGCCICCNEAGAEEAAVVSVVCGSEVVFLSRVELELLLFPTTRNRTPRYTHNHQPHYR